MYLILWVLYTNFVCVFCTDNKILFRSIIWKSHLPISLCKFGLLCLLAFFTYSTDTFSKFMTYILIDSTYFYYYKISHCFEFWNYDLHYLFPYILLHKIYYRSYFFLFSLHWPIMLCIAIFHFTLFLYYRRLLNFFICYMYVSYFQVHHF